MPNTLMAMGSWTLSGRVPKVSGESAGLGQLGVFLAFRHESRHQRHVVVDGRLLVEDEHVHHFAQLGEREPADVVDGLQEATAIQALAAGDDGHAQCRGRALVDVEAVVFLEAVDARGALQQAVEDGFLLVSGQLGSRSRRWRPPACRRSSASRRRSPNPGRSARSSRGWCRAPEWGLPARWAR